MGYDANYVIAYDVWDMYRTVQVGLFTSLLSSDQSVVLSNFRSVTQAFSTRTFFVYLLNVITDRKSVLLFFCRLFSKKSTVPAKFVPLT